MPGLGKFREAADELQKALHETDNKMSESEGVLLVADLLIAFMDCHLMYMAKISDDIKRIR